jgi:hypothetical protein
MRPNIVLLILFASMFAAVTLAAEPLSEKAKIEALIERVEKLAGAKFVRNGTEYDAKTAAKFLRGKWQSNGKEIETARQFIEKVGSSSGTTGKPYLIRFSDREVKSGAYFLEELMKVEAGSGK